MANDYEKLAKRLVQRALKRGATEAEAFLEVGRQSSCRVRDGEVEDLTQATSKGVGLRVIVKGRLGFASTSDFEPGALDTFVDRAVQLAQAAAPNKLNGLPGKRDLGKPVTAMEDWESTVRGADIVVEASRLPAPAPLLRTDWIRPGAFVVPYGTMSAVELSITDIMDKMLVDDWGQCRKGLPFGALRQHVDSDRLTESNLALGLTNEAQTAAAVLGHNYPSSSWYKQSLDLLQRVGLQPKVNTASPLATSLQG